MDVEGGEVDARVSLYDRTINAYGEARAAIKAVLQLGQGEAAAAEGKGAHGGARPQTGACAGSSGLLPHWLAVEPEMPHLAAGGADSEQLRGELVSLDRAVQGLALEKTIQVCGLGEVYCGVGWEARPNMASVALWQIAGQSRQMGRQSRRCHSVHAHPLLIVWIWG